MATSSVSRRTFLESLAVSLAGAALPRRLQASSVLTAPVLDEFGYGDVDLKSPLHEKQLDHHLELLMSLNEDSLLKPFRQMIGKPAPGEDLGGWYGYNPKDDGIDGAYAPSCTYGQWVSALARMYAIRQRPEIREKVLRLNRLYAEVIDGQYFKTNHFPTYCHDKLLCGLMDAHEFAQDPDAFDIQKRSIAAALAHMPGKAIDDSDESFTASENLFIAFRRGAGEPYRKLGVDYLADYYYDPLSEGHDNLAGRHAYSHVNSLSSAAQAYLTIGSEKHLRAVRNGFDFLTAQSYATGGWGPDETLRTPSNGEVAASLSNSHASFETPCGSYAHFKITRYLLRMTRDTRYGDSMEQVMYNTVLGAKPIQPDGRCFYYSDYNFEGRKVYSSRRWACCSGTLPQVAADYRINTYFRDRQGIYANLYIPSTVRWNHAGSRVSLTQKSAYPFDGTVQFELTLARPAEFTANFRIPEWAQGAAVAVNGKRIKADVVPGSFAAVRREWRSGDRLELELPMTTRLQAVDTQHPNTVALLRGPLVLFAITKSAPKVSRKQLLAATSVGAAKWQVATAQEPLTMLPFTAIEDEQYSTYLQVVESD
ncbi:MAG TPA: beta-L-arabinofuranosidase domain-containing protein [Candidatus Acidoferrum sp.]|nr:beta-L-arabinofuranosidase domain-containing protein [Candidatus Acidoferrum sp.]